MKIGLVLDDGLDTTDGVQQYVLHIGAWLSQQGHEVHYIVGQTSRTDLPNLHSVSRNMSVHFNGNKMSMPLPTSRKSLRNLLQSQHFDVLHVQVPYSPFMGGRLLSVAEPTTAVVGTFHILPYSYIVKAANSFLRLLNHRSGKRFDTMLAVSAPAQKFAKRTYGYEAAVVPNPVDVRHFETAVSTSPDINIVFLGRLVERKGARYLLEAVQYIRVHGLYTGDFKVHIGGKGGLLESLQRYVEDNGLQQVVTFHGFIAEADKPAFLAQADIAVYPSTGGESFGIVLTEAMAAARGVVLAGNNPGYASVMSPFPDQLFYPTDTKAFAERLAWYLAHDIGRARANEMQRQYVTRFDSTVVGTKLLQVYQTALHKRRQS